jgi:CRISPR-associated protein Cmr1
VHVARRIGFGLPHNYDRDANRRAIGFVPHGGERRASPLLLHIHRLAKGQCISVGTFLPARFTANDRLQAYHPNRHGGRKPIFAVPSDWDSPVIDFLNTRFPSSSPVLP